MHQAKYRVININRFNRPTMILISQGDLICSCCGNKNSRWLQIDHILPAKGTQKAKHMLCRMIVLGIIPSSDYQLLCANCNFAKRDRVKCIIDHSLD